MYSHVKFWVTQDCHSLASARTSSGATRAAIVNPQRTKIAIRAVTS